MTVITRWDPSREFSTLQERMNRLFRDSFGDGQEALSTSTFAPSAIRFISAARRTRLMAKRPGRRSEMDFMGAE